MSNKKDKLLLKESEKCCSPADEGGPDNQPHNCVEQWRFELKTATQDYNEAASQATGIEKIYTNLVAWEGKLKFWVKNAETADKTLSDMLADLQQFMTLTATLRYNSRKTGHAVQILICLVKHIFDDVCELLQNSSDSPDVKGLIQKLKDYIECKSNLDEQKKMDALKCVSNYEDKVKVVFELQEAVLTKLLVILSNAKMLAKGVGNNKGNFGWGLYKQLEDLESRIQGQNPESKTKKCVHDAPDSQVKNNVLPPCGTGVLKPRVRILPVNNSNYYKDLKGLEKNAGDQILEQKANLDKIRQIRDSHLNRKNSLADAISAAEAAEKAK